MLRVALTGGIATGKTYCLRRFAGHGAPVADADRLARDAVAPGSAPLGAIVTRFGRAILAPDGALDRRRLAAIVFADPDARRDLERIVHPVVYRMIAEWFAALEAGGRRLGIADIPLLFETGHAGDFDRVVVAACPPDLQVRRLVDRDGLAEAEARRRLAAQWPIAEKRGAADFVIDTSGTTAETDARVDTVWAALQAVARSPAGR
jgi:dephospho-CoA kinase